MKFRGKLKSIHKELLSENYIVSFEMEEGDLEQADKIKDREIVVTAEAFKDLRSGEANRLLWDCLGKIAKFENKDKWQVYLESLKKYGQYTYFNMNAEAFESFKENWRECEVIGEFELDGVTYVEVLCYFGSSHYTSKEFAILLDGVIQDLQDCGGDRPLSREMKRAIEQWNQYCKNQETDVSFAEGQGN